MIENDIEKMSVKFNQKLKLYFKNRPYVLIIYGSSVWGKIKKDLDFCILMHSYQKEDINNLKIIFNNFNIEHNLISDDEIPFENKCIYSFREVENILENPPFEIIRNKYIIQPILKTNEYLSSNVMRCRLLLNILTNNTCIINENNLNIINYQENAWFTLIRLIFSNIMNEWLNIDEFIHNLYKNPFGEEKGEFYLGYDISNEKLYFYLKEKVFHYFSKLIINKEIIENDEKYKYNSKSLVEFVFSRFSNNSELNLKKYKKMYGYDFSENSNPFGPPKNLIKSISNCWKYINTYPDYTNIEENKKLSDFFIISEKNICICNGSLEAIFALPEIIKSKNAAIITPTYWGYEAALKNLNIIYSKYNVDESLEYNYTCILNIAKKHDLIFICNPNNPTSSYICKEQLRKIIINNPKCHFIIDESHLLLSNNYNSESLKEEVYNLNNLSLVYSLSKFFSIASLRVGALISNELIIKCYKEWQVPYSLSTLSQVLFNLAIEDSFFVKNTRNNLHKCVDKLYNDLKKIEWLEPKKSVTNFVLCKIKYGITAIELSEKLEKNNIYIRELTTCYSDIKGEWIRISVNTPELNKYLIKKLKEIDLVF